MRRLTVDDIMALQPCEDWPRERVEKYFAGRESVTVEEILGNEGLDEEDRIGIGISLLDDKHKRLFACWCVRQVWHLLTDSRGKNAIKVAERYANGQATDKELNIAGAAAWDAALVATRATATATAAARASAAALAATSAATWAAASAAALAATSAATWAATRAAAWEAAHAANKSTARGAQLQRIIELLRGNRLCTACTNVYRAVIALTAQLETLVEILQEQRRSEKHDR